MAGGALLGYEGFGIMGQYFVRLDFKRTSLKQIVDIL